MTKRPFLLYAKPRRAPKWWPRNGRIVRWAGVMREGVGFVIGQDGDRMTAAEVAQAKRLLDLPGAKFMKALVPTKAR